MENEEVNKYKEMLIALCEGLELQKIDALLTKSPDHFKKIGIEIAKYAKVGAGLGIQLSQGE